VLNLRAVLFALGLMLCTVAAVMVLPAAVELADAQDGWKVFLASSVLTFFVGGLLVLFAYDETPGQLGIKEGFLLTSLSWLIISIFAAAPFVGHGLSYSDAFFESMSGLTTTGSSILADVESMPRGILFWRALLQGIGGIGIIAVAIIMLPFLRVGGMQLFQMENTDRSEKVLPRAFELTIAIAGIYMGLIVVCAIGFVWGGMTGFDAICHALATLSTGGFSTRNASFGYFQSSFVEWTAVLFMILGALPFVVYIKVVRGSPASFWQDVQIRGFLVFLLAVWLIVAIWLTMTREIGFLDAFRMAAFNVTSVVTTTGFASEDYTRWGPFAVGVFFLLMFVGGCTGSTSGSIKIYRLQVASMLTRSHFLHLISPHRVVTLVYNKRRLPPDVPFSVVAFLAVYFATVGMFSVLYSAMGLDFITAFSASATALSNVGPGIGDTIGPAGNFSSLPAAAKWALSFQMLLGRLELFTVLVLFRPEFWRS
jgi:trk system potassium uptake protein TrkH